MSGSKGTLDDPLGDAMAHAMAALEVLGPLRVAAGQLFAGDTALVDGALVDDVRAATGFGCTVFLGNVRVATTAETTDRPGRALGTEANALVTEHVLGRGLVFRGITHTIGVDWKIIYRPLVVDRAPVGMLAVFKRLDEVLG